MPYPVAASRGKIFSGPIPWHLILPVANGLAAFQPYGAASYAASKVNLFGVSANNASDGAAYPGWAANTGWDFTAASSQYLNVGTGALVTAVPLTFAVLFKVPDITTNYMLASIKTKTGNNNGWFAMAAGGSTGDWIRAYAVNVTSGFAVSHAAYTANEWHTSITTFVNDSARYSYLDGVAPTANTTTKTPATDVDSTVIGAHYDGSGSPSVFLQGCIGAWSLHNIAVSVPAQAAAMSAAMLALVA